MAAGLSLIFGVTRIVNFAHGSFYMVGIYIAYTLVERLGGGIGFWPALLLAALAVGVLGALVEMVLLRRIYQAPELFQLLATFALVLVIKDAVLWLWGPDELLGPARAGPLGLGRDPRPALLLQLIGTGDVAVQRRPAHSGRRRNGLHRDRRMHPQQLHGSVDDRHAVAFRDRAPSGGSRGGDVRHG